MQRNTAGFYQPLSDRSEDYLALTQAHNTTSAGSLSHLHWKKKILNKPGTNKRRQNPARQAAVRSFKKYQFSNQDFLLRKYLRSVKKELRPKQCETPVEPTPSIINAPGGCCRTSRQLADVNCSRHNPGINEIRCKISNNVSSSSTTSSTNNKKHISDQEMDTSLKINKFKEFNTEQEIKKCPRRNWPVRGSERPTFENVEITSPPLAMFDDELKELVDESGDLIVQYCKSLRDLSQIINYDNYDILVNDGELYNGFGDQQGNRIKKSNKTINGYHHEKVADVNCSGVIDERTYGDHSEGGQIKFIDSNNLSNDSYKINEFHSDDYDDNSDSNNDDDCDEDDDDEDDDDDSNGVGEEDDTDGEVEEDDDDYDDDSDDEEDDNNNDDNNSDEDDNSDNSNVKENERDDFRMSNERFNRRHDSELVNIHNTDNSKNISAQDVVVSVDTTDSSSVSSSVDNTSLSTETCSDNPGINSDNQDVCDFKNKNISSIQCDELETNKLFSKITQKQHRYITIRNREYPVSILDNNPTLMQYLKETHQNMLPENVIINNQEKEPSEANPIGSKITVKRNTPDKKMRIKDGRLEASVSVSGVQKSQRYIKIRNKEYPGPVFNSNPKFKESFRESQLNSLSETINNQDSQPSVVNHSETRTTVRSNKTEEKMRSVKKVHLASNYHDDLNLRKNQSLKQFGSSEQAHGILKVNDVQVQNKKVRRTFNLEKNKDNKLHDLLSSVCSVEDGLAFLDKQNVTTPPVNVHTPLNSCTPQLSETITLYNHSTSCTLPYPASTSQDSHKKSQSKKLSNRHQNVSAEQTLLPNSVASQANILSIKGNQSLISQENSLFQCPQCKQVDADLKESLENSFVHLESLVTSSIVLNSLITGEKILDKTSKFCSDLNSQ